MHIPDRLFTTEAQRTQRTFGQRSTIRVPIVPIFRYLGARTIPIYYFRFPIDDLRFTIHALPLYHNTDCTDTVVLHRWYSSAVCQLLSVDHKGRCRRKSFTSCGYRCTIPDMPHASRRLSEDTIISTRASAGMWVFDGLSGMQSGQAPGRESQYRTPDPNRFKASLIEFVMSYVTGPGSKDAK